MTDQVIKRFQFEVQVKDSGQWLRQYATLIGTFTDQLRDKGYVPVLDLDPFVRMEYDEENDVFNAVVTIQTIYVGRKVACKTQGVAQGKLLARSTPSPKSKPS